MATKTLTRSMTYAQLVAAIGASALNKGESITITDFATVHYMLDGNDVWLDSESNPEINIGTTEPLTVLALSANTISHEAKSALYPQDIIHYDWNPDNWIYDIGFSAFDEVVLTGFKGVIYFRHDSINNNLMGYDFRKVKFRRWNNGFIDTDHYVNEYQSAYSDGNGVIDANDYIDSLTFNCPDGELQYNNEVKGNKFFSTNTYNIYILQTILTNNVFYLDASYQNIQVYANTFNIGFCLNTLNEFCESNIVGQYSYSNIIGKQFYQNFIESGFKNNTIKSYFSFNNMSSDNYGNVIGNDFFGNKTSCDFRTNVVGNYVLTNVFGVSFENNIIGDEFYSNTIFNHVSRCDFGDFFYYNIVENDVQWVITKDSEYGVDEAKYNIIKNGVKGIQAAPLDFTAATHIYANYNCEIFKRLDGTIKLRYVDNSDADVVVAYNA